MTDVRIDLSKFPPALHRIVKAWYAWQGVNLRKVGKQPGQDSRSPKRWETPEQVFWGARPPRMVTDTELAMGDDSDGGYFLTSENGVHYIDEKERAARGRYWMFRRFEDAEKALLLLISQAARPGKYSDSPRANWHKQGLNSGIYLDKPDAENFPGRVCMTVDHEPQDRGWMGENDAIAFSHAITMTYDELDRALREDVPPEWFVDVDSD